MQWYLQCLRLAQARPFEFDVVSTILSALCTVAGNASRHPSISDAMRVAYPVLSVCAHAKLVAVGMAAFVRVFVSLWSGWCVLISALGVVRDVRTLACASVGARARWCVLVWSCLCRPLPPPSCC